MSLRVEAGEYLLLAGANGSGKSTLLRLLNGLIPHFYAGQLQGQVRVSGLNPLQQPVHELFDRVALLAQNPQAQFFSPTVRRELAFGLESLGLARTEIERRMAQVVNQFGLQPLLDCEPAELSGGEQQRVLLAALLALRPAVLALDEPLAALDYTGTVGVEQELERLHQQGTTIIVAEQRLNHLLSGSQAKRCLLMERGQLVVEGALGQVFSESNLASRPELWPPLPALFKRSQLSARPLNLTEAVQICHSEKLEVTSQVTINQHYNQYQPRLKLENVSLQTNSKHQPILEMLNIQLGVGEVVALLGRNGAGKTTLARHCVGLLPAVSGQSWLKNEPLYRQHRHLWGRSQAESNLTPGQVGFMFQNPDQQLFLPTVKAELEFGMRLLKRGQPEQLAELVERLDLKSLLGRNPLTLSGGEKKRVTLATTLATAPELVVLDEPTAGLDYGHQPQVLQLIKQIVSEGCTVLLITHDLELAAQIASRWLILANHRLVADWQVQDLPPNLNFLLEGYGLEPPPVAYLATQLGQAYQGGLSYLTKQPSLSNGRGEQRC